jgi:hypothetical protein
MIDDFDGLEELFEGFFEFLMWCFIFDADANFIKKAFTVFMWIILIVGLIFGSHWLIGYLF